MDALKQQVLKDGLVLGPEIGRGSFGVVYRCTDIKTQINYAVKKIDLRTLRMQPNFVLARLKRECTVLQGLQHPSVVRLFKTIEADDAVLMVMEMVLGMELFDLILAVSGLGESEACAVFIQIASALAYMHSKGVIHRDIKPENILIQGTTSGSQDHDMGDTVISDTFQHLNPRVKLIDFGLSKSLGNNSPEGSIAKSLVGTPRYVAPEILAIGEKMQKTNRDLQPSQEPLETLSYTEKVDCYSTGVLLHVMLSACFPQFEGKQELIFADPRVANVSSEAKDLISKLMLNDPNERLSIKDALCHPWVKRHHPRAAIAASRLAGVSVGPSPPVSPKHRDSQQLAASYLSQRPSKQLPFETKQHASSTPMQVEGEDGSLRPSGLKRHISTPDPMDNHNLEARTRTQSLNSKSGSRSSIETLNLPGSAKGVWGPYIESSDTPEGTPERGYKTSSHQRSIEESEESLEFRASPEQSKAQMGSSAMDVEADRGTTSRDRKRDAEDSNDGQGESREALVPRLNNTINPHGTDEISMGSFKGEAIANPEILLQLQTRIAKCFHQSFNAFKDDDVVSPGIVSSAVASRELLGASETIVKKLEQTSLSVLDLLPDMEIAVEEGEFGMAVTCFDTIKEWIRAIQAESQELLKANVKVIASVNNTLQLARRRQRVKEATEAGFRVSDALALEAEFQNELRPTTSLETGTKGGAVEAAQAGERESTDALKRHELQEILQERQSSDQTDLPKGVAESMRNQLRLAEHRREAQIKSQLGTHKTPRPGLHGDHLETTTALVPAANGDLMVVENEGERPNREIEPITNALAMLQQIDHLLQQHASFWTHMELVVDVLMQRANHVESMVNFTRNPRLRGRFLERVHEYSSMWTRMTQMCQQFHRDSNRVEGGKLYQFLRDL